MLHQYLPTSSLPLVEWSTDFQPCSDLVLTCVLSDVMTALGSKSLSVHPVMRLHTHCDSPPVTGSHHLLYTAKKVICAFNWSDKWVECQWVYVSERERKREKSKVGKTESRARTELMRCCGFYVCFFFCTLCCGGVPSSRGVAGSWSRLQVGCTEEYICVIISRK